MKILPKFFVILLILLLLIVGFIGYAALPGSFDFSKHPAGIISLKASVPPMPTLQPRQMKMVTYNIGYASGDKNNKGSILTRAEVMANLDRMATELKNLNADVIAMQEVDFDAKRSFGINQMAYLQKALGMPHGAYVITWNKRYMPWPYWPPQHHFGRVVSGQAILSRYPILKQENHLFDKPEANAFWYNWFYLDRIAQRLILDLGEEKKATVWNVHLEAFDPEARLKQAGELAEMIKRDPEKNLWVLGDINSASFIRGGMNEQQLKEFEESPQALRLLLIESGLLNAEMGDKIYTMPSWDPVKKIDHVLYHPTLILQRSGTVPGLMASDHLMVWAEFVVP